jgi:hypothetical protein
MTPRRMEILFWRHCTTAQKRKGMCTIYTRVTIFGRRAELGSTGIKTFADHWDQERQEVTAVVYMPQYVRRYYAIGLHSTRARLTGV